MSKIDLKLAALLLLTLVSCTSYPEDRGYVMHQENLEKIAVGQTDKSGVTELLGSPSTKSDYGTEKWYYIGKKATATAFFDPIVSEQNILALEFDKDGKVGNIQKYSLKDSLDVPPVQEVTRTEGSTPSLMEQLLGNVGRFNSESHARPGAPVGIP